jgi:hypothetical protein
LHPTAEPASCLQKRIDELWAAVRTRLLRTEKPATLPLLSLLREHKLSDEETMIVVHLLFEELYHGEPNVEAVDLLCLVSIDDASLLRAKKLLHKNSPLVKGQIVALEPYVENRELTAEVRLQDWVVTQLLDDEGGAGGIQSDERMRWHQYLSQLEGSDGFFRDLDA